MELDAMKKLIKYTETELMVAENKFNNAINPTDIDIASIDIKACEDKLNILYKKAKEMEEWRRVQYVEEYQQNLTT